eukprot:131527_1
MANITRQITANNAVIVDIDFVVKSNKHNKMMRYIQKFGMIKNKTYNSAQEREDDEVIDSEDDEVIIQGLRQQLEAKNDAIRELEAGKMRQQERIQELQTNVTNGAAEQQRNLAQLKDSLSFSANDEQQFRWLRNDDDEKKENDMECVKIVTDNPIRIAFVDGKIQGSSNDVLSLAPPVDTIDGICKCNKQIVNGVQTLMKDVRGRRDFVYQSDFDTNGICYALGTDFGTKEWQNPMEQGLVTVDSLHGWGTGEAKGVVARVISYNYAPDQENGYIRISFTNASIQPTAYTWRHTAFNSSHYPRNWNFEGSNDNVTWDILKRHVNDAEHGIDSKEKSHTWTITNCNKAYKMFRFKITGKNSNGNYYIMCGGFEIYGD